MEGRKDNRGEGAKSEEGRKDREQYLSGFHTGLWGREQDGSRMIVVCESTLMHTRLLAPQPLCMKS